MEPERGIGVTNEPVRTIDDDRGRPASSCCDDLHNIDDERGKGPPPFANGGIGIATVSWDVRTIDDERCKAPGAFAGGTIDTAGWFGRPPE